MNPGKFKEDFEVAVLEGKATGEAILKTIENLVNGRKSSDMADPERRTLNEIKESIIRVKTAPQMESIAEAKDLNSPDVLKQLDIAAIEKYDPYDPNLPIKVRQRVEKTLEDGKVPGVFYDEILHFNKTQNQWQTIGKLPEAAAYGVSVAIPDGYLWIGGQTATNSLANCYKVQYSKEKALTLNSFPALPEPLDNFSGASVGSKVFVAGGNASGKASNKVFYINTATDKEWKQLPDFPGDARVQPVLAAIEKDNDTLLYVLGGFFGGDATKTPTMGEKVLAFSLKQQQWHEVALQENPNKEIFSLTGATALAIDNRYIACFGGVNHSLFINTITDLYHLGKDTSLTDDQRKQKNYDYMSHYMTQPIEYYKFNQECYLFDTHTKQWSVLNTQPDFARAGATLVGTPSEFYLIQGELKPGVRSPKTYKLKILSN